IFPAMLPAGKAEQPSGSFGGMVAALATWPETLDGNGAWLRMPAMFCGPPATETTFAATRSCVLLATVATHGPRWFTWPIGLVTVGLVLPAEAATKMPALTISRNARSPSLFDHGLVPPEIE